LKRTAHAQTNSTGKRKTFKQGVSFIHKMIAAFVAALMIVGMLPLAALAAAPQSAAGGGAPSL
jgi:hypothetical protein